MLLVSDADKAEVKKIAADRVTADSVLSRKACFVHGVHLTGSSGGASTATVYNGESTGDDVKIDLSCATSGRDNKRFAPPLYFDKGLYVDVGSNVTSVLVQWQYA